MKTKRAIIISILFCVCLPGCSFFSGGGEEFHQYSTAWSNDENYHWHRCIMANHDDKSDYGPHEFERIYTAPDYDINGSTIDKCKICGYEKTIESIPHLEHHYAEEYEHDAFDHWHRCIDEGYEDLESEHVPHDFTIVISNAGDYKAGYEIETCDCGLEYRTFREYPNFYTVTWKNYDGEDLYIDSHVLKDTVPVYYGPECEKEIEGDPRSYHFIGWDKEITKIKGNTTYIAQYEVVRDSYYVTYLNADDTVLHSVSTNSADDAFAYLSKTPTLKSTEENRFVFSKWNKESDDDNGTIVYKAEYNSYPFGLTFNMNGAIRGYSGTAEELVIPEFYEGVQMVEIGQSAFENNKTLKKITLPNSIKKIGYNAFLGCEKLESIVLSENLESIGSSSFEDCISLKEIDIPASTKDVYYDVFLNCVSLKSVTLHEGLESIGSNAFDTCTQLKSIQIPNSVEYIDENVFRNCALLESISIPFVGYSAKSTGSSALFGYIFGDVEGKTNTSQYVNSSTTFECYIPETLKTVTINGGKIKTGAFSDCKNITTIVLPEGVNSFGDKAFYNCKALTNLCSAKDVKDFGFDAMNDLNDSNYHIEDNCIYFKSDENIYHCFVGLVDKTVKSCSINDACDYIQFGALKGCNSLENIYIPFIGKSITEESYFSYIFGCSKENSTYVPASLVRVRLGESIKTIPESAFYGCKNIQYIDFSDIKEIKSKAFYNCSALVELKIPNSVNKLGEQCFVGLNKDLFTIKSAGKYIGNDDNPYFIFVNYYNDGTNYSTLKVMNDCKLIAGKAFSESCKSSTINIGANVKFIGSSAFREMYSLSTIVVSDDNLYFSSKDGVLFNKDKTTLVCVPQLNESNSVFPASLTRIEEYALYKNENIVTASIPSSVTYIGKGALSGCYNIKTLYVGSACESGDKTLDYNYLFEDKPTRSLNKLHINEGCENFTSEHFIGCEELYIPSTFKDGIEELGFYCQSLKKIDVHYQNPYFKSVDNVLYSKDGSELIKYPTCLGNSEYEIDSNVRTIKTYAFRFPDGLRTLIIPDTVTKIERDAIYTYSDLTKIQLPFVGGSKTDDNSFGYIFGAVTYEGNKDVVPSCLREVVLSDSCESIPDNAFTDCKHIERIEIGKNVKSIGKNAFDNCLNLQSIIVSSSNNDFSSQFGILFDKYKTEIVHCPLSIEEDITIPNTVTSIKDETFKDRSLLKLVVFANDDVNLGKDVFSGCTSLALNEYGGCLYLGTAENPYVYLVKIKDLTLKEVTISPRCKYILNGAFENASLLEKVTIPSSIKRIDDSAFKECRSLVSVEFENNSSLLKLGNEAFMNCTEVKSIEIPTNVQSIGKASFKGCVKLESISLPFVGGSQEENTYFGYIFSNSYQSSSYSDVPSSLKIVRLLDGCKVIDSYAFERCTNIESLILPNTLETIKEYAFMYCNDLRTLVIPDSVQEIEMCALTYSNIENLTIPFIGGSRDKNQYLAYIYGQQLYIDSIYNYCTYGLKNLTLSESIKDIPEYAFYELTDLESIVLPKSLETIGDYAFYNCYGLTSLNLGNKLLSIGFCSFARCDGLQEIVIPDNVVNIGFYAFGSSGLNKITIPFVGTNRDDVDTDLTLIYGDNVNTIIFSDSCKMIPLNYLANLYNLTDVSIPSNIKVVDGLNINTTNLNMMSYEGGYYVGNESNPYLVLVELGDDFTRIHNSCKFITAEYSPANITSITIPANVEYIQPMFLDALNLTSFKVDSNSKNYSALDGILYNKDQSVLVKCPLKKEGSVTLPSSVKEIGPAAFACCYFITDVSLNDGLESIAEGAFLLTNLERISLPRTLKDVGALALSTEQNANTTISIASDNRYLCIENNVLYTANKDTLIYAWGKNRTTIDIPNTVKTIKQYALSDLRLGEITLPKSITCIEENAIRTKEGTFLIYFEGTFDELNNIILYPYCLGQNIRIICCSDRDAVYSINE